MRAKNISGRAHAQQSPRMVCFGTIPRSHSETKQATTNACVHEFHRLWDYEHKQHYYDEGVGTVVASGRYAYLG